ncbi:MAG: sulfite exporter TauE/SafE family protein [Pedosphaera sp.]|nr:sulfite exporter TauE/SafE family protein [Pedosphaera sp.]
MSHVEEVTLLGPTMSAIELLGLTASAVAAGVINAVAGGGTLLTFPTLLFFNTPPVVANAINTLALAIGTAGSVYGYRRHLGTVRPWLWRFIPVSVLGGLIGSVLLTHTSDKTFSKLVPFLILFATVLFLAQGIFRRFAGLDDRSGKHAEHHAIFGAILFQFAVAIYGGYFGAGIGILMLASLGFVGLSNIHEMNALKTVLSSLINLVAAVWFISAGLIQWSKAGVMTLGAMAGYYLGSHYSQRIPQKRVRQIITIVGFVISAATFYKEFIR